MGRGRGNGTRASSTVPDEAAEHRAPVALLHPPAATRSWQRLVNHLWSEYTASDSRQDWIDHQVRSQAWIGNAHEFVKRDLLTCLREQSGQIHPGVGMSPHEGELAVQGAYKPKNVDVAWIPEGLDVGEEGYDRVLSLMVRSQWTSVTKNINSNLESFLGEAVNLHLRSPGMVLGQLMVIPVRDNHFVDDRPVVSASAVPVHRYVEALSMMGRRAEADGPVHEYEAVGLLVIDNTRSTPRPITSLQQLRAAVGASERPFVDALTDEQWQAVNPVTLCQRLVDHYQQRHPGAT